MKIILIAIIVTQSFSSLLNATTIGGKQFDDYISIIRLNNINVYGIDNNNDIHYGKVSKLNGFIKIIDLGTFAYSRDDKTIQYVKFRLKRNYDCDDCAKINEDYFIEKSYFEKHFRLDSRHGFGMLTLPFKYSFRDVDGTGDGGFIPEEFNIGLLYMYKPWFNSNLHLISSLQYTSIKVYENTDLVDKNGLSIVMGFSVEFNTNVHFIVAGGTDIVESSSGKTIGYPYLSLGLGMDFFSKIK